MFKSTFLWLLVLLVFFANTLLPAHHSFSQEKPKPSPIQKFKNFHQKVKQKLGLGKKETTENSAEAETESTTVPVDLPAPTQNFASNPNMVTTQRRAAAIPIVQNESSPRSPFATPPIHRNLSDQSRQYPNQAAVTGSGVNQAQYQEPIPNQPTPAYGAQPRHYHEPIRQQPVYAMQPAMPMPYPAHPQYYGQQGMMPPASAQQLGPHAQPPANQSAPNNWNTADSGGSRQLQAQPAGYSDSEGQGDGYRKGHYQNGMPIAGQRFSGQQVTATERALNLEAENRLLTSTRDALREEVKLLSKHLEENRELINKAQKAINDARNELSQANLSNKRLRTRVAELEAEKAAMVIESERQLDQIRKRLDDVLMREMTK